MPEDEVEEFARRLLSVLRELADFLKEMTGGALQIEFTSLPTIKRKVGSEPIVIYESVKSVDEIKGSEISVWVPVRVRGRNAIYIQNFRCSEELDLTPTTIPEIAYYEFTPGEFDEEGRPTKDFQDNFFRFIMLIRVVVDLIEIALKLMGRS